MIKTTVHQPHNKRTQCLQCNEFFLPQETGSVKVIVNRLIDRNAIVSGLFCSLRCAKKFIADEEYKKAKKKSPPFKKSVTET